MGSTIPFKDNLVSFTKRIVPSTFYALLPIALLCTYFHLLSLTPHSTTTTYHPSLSFPPAPPSSSSSLSTEKDKTYQNPCDYSNGDWVRDRRSPLYNVTTCGTIKESEKCISNGRPDSGYLYWRWKPNECNLPRFEPLTFLQLVQNKHIAFVGDSLARNQLESLLCMLSTISTPNLVYQSANDNKFRRWHFPSHNANFSLYWSPFLVQGVERSNEGPYYNTMYLDHVNERWARDLDWFDMVVVSFGHWFLLPSVYYENGSVIGSLNCQDLNHTQMDFYVPLRKVLRTTLSSIIERKKGKGNNGVDVIVKTFSPAHFEGDWNKAGTCSKTEPYKKEEKELEGMDAEIRKIEIEEVENAKAKASEFRGFRLEVLDVTKLALLRPDGHPGAYMNPFPFANGVNPKKPVQNDCVHWCLPGPIDTWITSSPENHLPHSIPITNHSSLTAPTPRSPVYEKPCDYSDGKWVRTKRGPLYNGTTCVKMKKNQNCIANGRPDLGYLFWRWKPSECHLPRFEPNIFLQLISNKHVAFVGDSVCRNHIESLLCMLATVIKPNRVRHEGSRRWLIPSHNAILSFYWSPFLVQGVQRQIKGPHYNTIHLDRVNIRWEKDLDEMDMIVLSFGHWFMAPSVYYEGEKVIGCLNHPVSNCTTEIGFYGPIRRALRTALNSIIERKVIKGNGVDVILRTYAPSHFEGDWDKGGSCAKTKPYGVWERQLEGKDAEIRRIELEEVENAKAKAKNFRGFRMEVMDVTKLALLRPDGHPGAYMNPFPFANGVPKRVQSDCVHWCLPGPIDTWSEIFLQMLENMARAAKDKRFSKKLLPSASYALPPIVLLCFSLYFFCLSFTSSPANEPPNSLSITNHSSLSASPLPPVYEKPCDYTNGRWVRTKRGPLYNATNCPNMKEKQNCIANGRPDLGYLNWRWKPSECNLPRFDPNTFLQLISNKHVAFVGDSVSRNHLQSLLCMLTTVTKPNGLGHEGSNTRWHFPSHNAMLSFYWSPFLVDGVDRKIRRPPHYNKIYLDRVNARWENDIDQMDIIVLSLGHWFLVPSVIYWGDKVIGCMNRLVSNCTTEIGFNGPIRRALRTALNSIIKKKVKKGNNGIDVIVRTYSPSHFEGAWDKGGICSKTKPYREWERQLEGEDAEIRRIQLEELERAKGKAKKFRRFRLEVLDVTKLALLRPDGHPGAYRNPFPFANGVPERVQNDCVHWCLPGPIDTWNEIRSSKRFSSNKKLEQPYVSYSLPPIVLLCFCVLYYCLFFTSSPANYEPPHSISITNHSSLVISTELISRSISIPNLSSSLSASPPPPPPPPVYDEKPIDQKIVYEKPCDYTNGRWVRTQRDPLYN
ncbi:Protein ALTERED XYLOGLUCAN 4 [Glycine max]|nr:Protein ALTERED XYLOGLUCAN 4 [Glycine max]